MNKEQIALDLAILHVQEVAGSAISREALEEFPNVTEIFDRIAYSIGKNRKRTSGFDYEELLRALPINYNSEHISGIVDKWVKLIIDLSSPTKYDLYPYSYEEMENIHNKIFFSELEAIADYLFDIDEDVGRMFVLYALVILGASANIKIFESKAAILLSLEKVPDWLTNNDVEAIKSFSALDDALMLIPYQTASLMKTLTAAGGSAQALESEDLEGGVTRINRLTPKDPNKQKRFNNVEDELRKLLATR